MLNKVPEVTIYFWVIKVLCTTVGETAADYMSDNLGLGEKLTAVVMAGVLVAALVWQFRKRGYVPSVYWLAVVLISIVGTLITDNLTDNYGVGTTVTTPIFAGALAATFAVWYGFERTLSIHTIFTRRREAFYWLTILFTFALGTAGGDLLSEKLSLGYWVATGIFAAAIAAVAVSHFVFRLNAVLAFWLAYILTRPLGASMGDGLSQTGNQGLALGTTVTSLIFLSVIAALVLYLTRTRLDATPALAGPADGANVLVVSDRAAATPALLDAVRGRAVRGAVGFRVLVPHPEGANGELALAQALPLVEDAAGGPVSGSVSTRHDPMDAIEETLREGHFDEIILATLPHDVAGWLHVDLPHRVAHLGVPVTTITTDHRPHAGGRPSRSHVGAALRGEA
jgi:uncharacterized membrane-anchored protein